MKYSLFLISCLFLLYSCVSSEVEENRLAEFRDDIQLLKTESEKDTFLANLFVQDQAMRISDEEEQAIAKYGYGSKEQKDFWKRVNENDLELFHQLRIYLEIHGYEKETAFFSDKAKWTFPYVTGHQGNYENQLHILKLLLPAYKRELIPMNDIVWIMSEMHERKYKKLFEVGKEPYTLEDEFEGLVEKLKLEKLFKD